MPRSDQAGIGWLETYQILFAAFGPQHWWPGETPFEVMVGAVLTQNTAWSNVEMAIANLAGADAMTGRAMLELDNVSLAELIRPAGCFNVKAKRLKALCEFLNGWEVIDTPERLAANELAGLREALRAVHGIGEETADSILLYALAKPSFVVDAYTRRIFQRLGLISGRESYRDIQALFTRQLPRELSLYNEYHALIVHLGKCFCRPRPRCSDCPLACRCLHGDNANHRT